MGAPSRKNIRTEVFTALANNPNCEYSFEQLEEFFSQTNGAEKISSKRRTSAFDMWKKLPKDEKEDLKWSDYKTKYPEKLAEFQIQADTYNKDHFEEKPKTVKKKNNNDELKKEIAKLKNKESSVKEISETEKNETNSESSNDNFDTIDTNNDGVISREEYEKYVNEQNSDKNEDNNEESEEKEENEEQEECEQTEIESNENNMAVFKGKDTPLNNYKEWKKDELGVDPSKSIPGADLKEYKEDDNFDPKDYDDSKPWFEYIKNNRQIA